MKIIFVKKKRAPNFTNSTKLSVPFFVGDMPSTRIRKKNVTNENVPKIVSDYFNGKRVTIIYHNR